ncbi:antitoxin ParD1/3/4 [Pseudomonas benzenivorans]|nr:type II toxin-antitoxin system ParD family antitoxin [Pseudomonas benzenivorans]SDG71077.1 antitoxin ParD1/3/4 [Pseudomonas benzenivorans]
MPTRNVVLPEKLEQEIDNLVTTGRYQNASEVIRAGLRLLLQHEAEESAKIEALRNATSHGIMQLESDLYDEVDSENLEQYLAELGQQAGAKH